MGNIRAKHQQILNTVSQYYSKKITEHGATHLGVDWKSTESQNLRFNQLFKILGDDHNSSVIDYGCGYGAMSAYMRKRGYTGQYLGFDISEAMITEASQQQVKVPKCTFVADLAALETMDYTIASGIFNVKLKIPYDKWHNYVIDTINTMAKYSRKGFAFNMLTSYSDKDKTRPDLFYGDPCFFIDHCVRTYSRQVAMLQDYGLYEFTILVKKT